MAAEDECSGIELAEFWEGNVMQEEQFLECTLSISMAVTLHQDERGKATEYGLNHITADHTSKV